MRFTSTLLGQLRDARNKKIGAIIAHVRFIEGAKLVQKGKSPSIVFWQMQSTVPTSFSTRAGENAEICGSQNQMTACHKILTVNLLLNLFSIETSLVSRTLAKSMNDGSASKPQTDGDDPLR